MTERLAELKTAATYSRSVFIMKSGWAPMPGMTDANACAEKLGMHDRSAISRWSVRCHKLGVSKFLQVP
jgi:hypothetical protein